MLFKFQNRQLDLSTPIVMGILNITPDSFFDGGQYTSEKELLLQAEKHINSGATILDIGAYSSRPGAEHVSEKEEIDRLLPALKTLNKHFPETLFSVDTFRASVAKVAIENSAFMINDISGGNLDENMPQFIGSQNIPYVLMHMRGTPQSMQTLTQYNYIGIDVINELSAKVHLFEKAGANQLIIDPGFGFSKTLEQNYQLLKHLKVMDQIPYPLLVGFSRKSMIYKKLGINPEEALNGTTVLNTIALISGAKILRVHDALEAQQTIELIKTVNA